MGKMEKVNKKFQLRNIKRWFKYQYFQLTRAKGGPSIVAKGFSIGLAIEMFTLPTAGLAFLLIFPSVYLFRASMAAALIGFVFGKIIYIPMAFINEKVGRLVLPHGIKGRLLEILPDWLDVFIKLNLKLLVGGIIVGIALGLLLYFPVKWLLHLYNEKRKEKRLLKKKHLNVSPESNG